MSYVFLIFSKLGSARVNASHDSGLYQNICPHYDVEVSVFTTEIEKGV